MPNYYSTLSGWLIPFSRAMESNGLNFQAECTECQISLTDLNNLESRLAADKLATLMRHCNQKLNRRDFATEVAKHFHPSMFHALGYAMMSSSSLHDALERLARYKRVVSNTCTIEMTEHDNDLLFEMHIDTYPDSKRPVLEACLVETFLATIVTFSRELVGSNMSPKMVKLTAAKPDIDDEYLEAFFNCPVEYACESNSLTFSREVADTKLMVGNTIITQIHEKILDELLNRIDKDDLIYLVKTIIYRELPMGAPSQNDIAKQLGMSLRNLQRKLVDKGTTYKDLLDTTRKKLALDYIRQQHISFSETGYLVGFASVSNFNRAFKRWTNKTPTEYRSSEM
ncbi:AraC family transcriptional regulator [Brumicola nitratireducens]|uniref:AraC family transcriptional regulator n=1 Tax=Glaciecola nitratireducens (strain JCM 12485 / KCTC 12276 / FR1064) TaxID=1085623 RepID=G4QN72_GLANF|nr:AraC family transcriptional regulator [Glaciecola nitratireducens]AEP31491.1 AraC family transcriptional regulator [Glaciecola nitratireducens FR1064]